MIKIKRLIQINHIIQTMAERKNPISIRLIEKGVYKLSMTLDNWEISKHITDSALNDLANEINNANGLSKISEVFNCSGEESSKIKKFWDTRRNWPFCNACSLKWKACHDCVVKCDSPLERDMLLELRKQNLAPVLQRRINKDGSFYDFPKPIDFDIILTIPDFYIEKNDLKLCIYADGHTYHERTEKQALRDRNIDRELQKMGYKVLRYTGHEIRKDCSLVVENILLNLD